MLLLGTYRDVELDRKHPLADALAGLRREAGHERLLLQGLSEDETVALVSAVGRQELAAPGRAFAAALHNETEGNPFFLQETLRHLVESGKLVQQEGRWRSTAASIAELGIPEGVQEVLGRRLSRLSDETNRLLGIASVAGREFHARLLELVSDASMDAIDSALEEAEAAGLVVPVAGAPDRYRFTHALVVETLYDELPARRRARLHEQIGTAIEQLFARVLDAHLAELAYHFSQATGEAATEKAVSYAVRAGDAAEAAFAYEEAVRLWQQALELAAETGAPVAVEAGLHARLGTLLHRTEFGPTPGRRQALEHLEWGIDLYERLGDEVHAARLHEIAAVAYVIWGPFWNKDRALAHAAAAEAVLGRTGDERVLWQVRAAQGLAAFAMLDTDAGLATTEKALAAITREEQPGPWASVAWLRGWFLWCVGRFDEGLELMRQAWLAADTVNEPDASWLAAYWRDVALLNLLNPAGTSLSEMELSRTRRAQGTNRVVLVHGRGGMQVRSGDIAAARLTANEVPAASGLRAMFLDFAQGDWDQVANTSGLNVDSGRAQGNRLQELIGWLGRGSDRSPQNTKEERERALREAVLLSAGTSVAFELAASARLARLLAEDGALDEARNLLSRCHTLMASGEDWHGLPGLIALADAVLATAEGRPDAGAAQFEAALATFRHYRAPWEEAEAEEAWARTLHVAGETDAANAHYLAAEEIYRRIGAGLPWIERIESLRKG